MGHITDYEEKRMNLYLPQTPQHRRRRSAALTVVLVMTFLFLAWKWCPASGQSWRFKVRADGGDLLASGMATSFNDHVTCSGIPADRPGLLGCALPRGRCAATKGSGFEGVPDLSLVRIHNPANGKVIVAVVIDEGPAWVAQAGTGRPGSAMIDLTHSALAALGMRDNGPVDIRILGGTSAAVRAGRRGLWR